MIDCLYTFLWFWTFSCNDNKISPDKKYEGGVPLCYPHKQVTSPPCQPTHRLRRTCHVLMLPVLASLHPLCLPTKQETHYSDVFAPDMPTLSVPFLAASQGAVYSSSAAAHALSYFSYEPVKKGKQVWQLCRCLFKGQQSTYDITMFSGEIKAKVLQRWRHPDSYCLNLRKKFSINKRNENLCSL